MVAFNRRNLLGVSALQAVAVKFFSIETKTNSVFGVRVKAKAVVKENIECT